MCIVKVLALTLAGSAAALVFAFSGHGQGASVDASPAAGGIHVMATPLDDSGWQ